VGSLVPFKRSKPLLADVPSRTPRSILLVSVLLFALLFWLSTGDPEPTYTRNHGRDTSQIALNVPGLSSPSKTIVMSQPTALSPVDRRLRARNLYALMEDLQTADVEE